jgi:tetratricopeptide (TPR) repeat protein
MLERFTTENINKLGDESFEELCKALLCKVIGPGIKPFGAGKDGAREATFEGKASYPNEQSAWGGKWIFQVKYADYSVDPSKARTRIKGYIDSELEKIKDYGYFKDNKCDNYILITNVPFTGENKVGMHDKISEKIQEIENNFPGKKIDYWDGEQIRNYLRAYPDLKEEFFPSISQKILDEVIKQNQTSIRVEQKLDATGNNKDKLELISSQISESKSLIDNNKPGSALIILEKVQERFLNVLDDESKFKLFTNIGVAKSKFIKDGSELTFKRHIAQCFDDALKIKPNDEKALCNAAIGNQMIGNDKRANELAMKVLEINNSSDKAFSIIVNSLSKRGKLLEDILNEIPEKYHSQPRTACSIGTSLFIKDKVKDARDWYEKSINSRNESDEDLAKKLYSTATVQLAINEKKHKGFVSEVLKKDLEKSINYLTEIWKKFYKTELMHLYIDVLGERANAKHYLGETKEAIRDMDFALEQEPDNLLVLVNKANMELSIGEISNKTIEKVEKVYKGSGHDQLPLLLIDLLVVAGKEKDAIPLTEQYILDYPNNLYIEDIKQKLVVLYLRRSTKESLEKAKALNKELIKQNPKSILHFIDEAEIKRVEGADGKSSLLVAIKSVSDEALSGELLSLAETLFKFGLFKEAADIYSRITDLNIPSPNLEKLLSALSRSDQGNEAMNICRNLRLIHGPLIGYSDEEARRLINKGVKENKKELIETARDIFEKLIEKHDNDIWLKINKATCDFHLEDFSKLNTFLESDINMDSFDEEMFVNLSVMLLQRNYFEKAVHVIYEGWRRYPTSLIIGDKYNAIFLYSSSHLNIEEFRKIQKANYGCAICIEGERNKDQWFLIENRQDIRQEINEINMSKSKSLVEQFLGKSIGDEVTIGGTLGLSNKRKIKDIIHKYAYAFDKCVEYTDIHNPSGTQMVRAHIDENITPEDFISLLNQSVEEMKKRTSSNEDIE